MLVAFYGDDFTGSTDSMEVLALHGFRTILFTQEPDMDMMKQFSNVECLGIAGISRSLPTEQLATTLTPIFEKLRLLNAKLVHYKLCSTFDSSPSVGSIGRSIEIARSVFGLRRGNPLLVGAPPLKRYTIFGNHFATVGDMTYRLDRHPTMSRHPVTPMHESDLRLHLKQQTDLQIGLLDILELSRDTQSVEQMYLSKCESNDIVLLDVLDDEHLRGAGSLIWNDDSGFVAGSSGVEYALIEHWKEIGIASSFKISYQSTSHPQQIVVVSGSCSPVTQTQIAWAMENGFVGIRVDVAGLLNPLTSHGVWETTMNDAIELIRTGRSVVLYTAQGPEDEHIARVRSVGLERSIGMDELSALLGSLLGRLLKALIVQTNVKRVAIAGGDTSGFAVRELGLYALEAVEPIDPGSPLCIGYSNDSTLDGLEIALKGGQVGREDYFGRVARVIH